VPTTEVDDRGDTQLASDLFGQDALRCIKIIRMKETIVF
jgi:hypothetical protein